MQSRIIFIAIFLICSPLYATRYVPQPLTVYFKAAETVAVVQIISAEAIQFEHDSETLWCATKYKAQVAESFKGQKEIVEFVSGDENFRLGEAYLVFLEDKTKAKTPVMSSSHFSDGGGPIDKINECQRDLKGLKPNWLATSHFVSTTRDPATGKNIEWITPPYNISRSKDVKWVRVKIKSIVIDDKEISKDYWSSSEYPLTDDIIYYDGALTWSSYKANMLKQIKELK